MQAINPENAVFAQVRFRLPMGVATEVKRLAKLHQRSFVAEIRYAVDRWLIYNHEEVSHGDRDPAHR